MAMPTIKDVKEWDTKDLINFLREQNLKLDEKHFEVFRAQEITGLAFLKLTKKELEKCGLKSGPAIIITGLIKKITNEVQSKHQDNSNLLIFIIFISITSLRNFTAKKKKFKMPKFVSFKRRRDSNKDQLTIAMKEQTIASTAATQKVDNFEKALVQDSSTISSTQVICDEEDQAEGSDSNDESNESFLFFY
jgi:hypothetical protein